MLLCYSIDNFDFAFNANEGIGFKAKYCFEIAVLSGTLNGSSASLRIWNDKGELKFTSENSATIRASSPDCKYLAIPTKEGLSVQSVQNHTYLMTVPSASSIVIVWRFGLESWIDKYTMLGIGLGGLFLMIFSPTWVGLKLKKSGLDADSMERIGYGMLLFITGFGLLVIWLWS